MHLAPDSFAAALAQERGCVVLPDGSGYAIPLGGTSGRRGPLSDDAKPYARIPGDCAVVSPEDKDLARFAWAKNVHGYAQRREGGRSSPTTVRMQREIYERAHGEIPEDMQIDHINRDRLDNRRENLRAATHAQNSQNLSPRRGGKSKHRGVSFKGDGRARPWRAEHMVAGVKHFLGYFATEEEAAAASLAFRQEHMPFANN